MRKIIFSAAGSRDFASCRLRCHMLQENVAALGYATGWFGEGTGKEDDVVFFVQKRVNEEILEYAARVRRGGGIVIFDIDDYGENALGWLNNNPEVLNRFVDLVDVVTVDTAQRKEVYEADPVFSRVPEIWVIPDPMDYFDPHWQQRLKERCAKVSGEDRVRGCWFGNAPNVVASEPFINALATLPRVSFSIISNAHFRDLLAQRFPGCEVLAWNADTFSETLRSFDFSFLAHASDVEGLQKSNNKMIAALSVGTLPFVTRTPAYAETAAAIGMPELIIDSAEHLVQTVASADFDALRRRLLEQGALAYLDSYSPRLVAIEFLTRVTAL